MANGFNTARAARYAVAFIASGGALGALLGYCWTLLPTRGNRG